MAGAKKAVAKGAVAKGAVAKGKERVEAAVEPAAPAVAGSQAAYARFLKDAEGFEARDVMVLNADPQVAYHNAVEGCDALLAARARVDATGHKVDWNLVGDMGELGLAVIFASSQVAPPEGESPLPVLLKEGARLRRLLRSDARSQVENGVFDAKKIAAIEKGSGPLDIANDLVAYSATYLPKMDALRGRTAVSAAQVRRAAELGTELQRRVRPAGAKRAPKRGDEERAAADRRNRFWTLLVNAYEAAERAGGSVWGRRLDAHMPALQARYAAKKRAKKDPPQTSGGTATG